MIPGHLHAATGCLRCIHLIVSSRIRENCVVGRDELEALMKTTLG